MPYQDYGGFGENYFEGKQVSNPHPAGYSDYTRELLPFDHYARKVKNELSNKGFSTSGLKILVVGCAYGYTVDQLQIEGLDAYGMDISQWAQDNAAGSVVGDIYQGDVTIKSDIQNVAQSTQGGDFSVIYSECALECLTDSEAQEACRNMADEASAAVIHRVWSTDGSDINEQEYNSKTLSEWQSLCDPNNQDIWYTERELQPEYVNS